MKMELIDIAVSDVIVRSTVRESMGDLTTLQNSVSNLGLICPILVNRQHVLICGSRRLQVCRNLGWRTIPALVIDVDADSVRALDMQCNENLCRKPLTHHELEAEIARKQAMLPGTGLFGRLVRRAFGQAAGKGRHQ